VLALRAIVLPRLARDAARVEVEPAPRVRALAVLATSARIASWRSPSAQAAQFHRAAELEARVPVLVATLPWADPPPVSLGAEILGALAAA
ncbi:MAG TPA: hypothetical protein VGW10_13895, partial [Solirubrobacteraceae bacterium]|nr:hypothetical protein [Solirubrobacteraceae bacterium]